MVRTEVSLPNSLSHVVPEQCGKWIRAALVESHV